MFERGATSQNGPPYHHICFFSGCIDDDASIADTARRAKRHVPQNFGPLEPDQYSLLLGKISSLLQFSFHFDDSGGAVHWPRTLAQRTAALDVLVSITQSIRDEDHKRYIYGRDPYWIHIAPAIFLSCADGDEELNHYATRYLRLALERRLLTKEDLDSSRQMLENVLSQRGAADLLSRLKALELQLS